MARTLLESVASLSLAKNLEFIEVWRAIPLSGEQEVVYYAGRVDTPDTDDVIQFIVDVWQKLLEAAKENRSITLDEIRINLERGEKLFYNPLRGRSTFLK